MNRNSYSDPQAHASFQPRSPQSAIDPTQLSQPVHHSSSTSDLGAKWLNKASGWVANKFQTAQNFVNGSGDAIAPDQILPALKGTASPNQPLVGVIDSGFGANEHGSKMAEAIQKENPQAQIWQGKGVGTGNWSESLVEFVDTAKAGGHSRAVANLSFDLTEVHPDGSTSNRSRLTADEQSALAYARNNDVLVVASSGNQGGAMSALGQASQPSDNLIVVGAANGSDRAAYSSYGNGLDLVADVGTAGTSLAAAKTTGAIANIWSANPELSSQQVNQILTTTAADLKAPGRDAETGAGLLNATGAIDLATHTTPEAIMFSGAQLIQQVSDFDEASSFSSGAWTSTDGAIASERPNWGWSDIAHGALDVAGFIPVVGAVADIANAGLYAAQGDYANAAMSAAAAVPGVGDAAAAVKLANRGVQAVRAANRGTRATQSVAARAFASPGAQAVRVANRGTRVTQSAAARTVPSRTLPGRSERPVAPKSAPLSGSRRPGQGAGGRPPAGTGRPLATPRRQQPVQERSGSPKAAPRPGLGRVTRAVAATTAVATVAPYVAPLVSEQVPRPNPSGSAPNPNPGQPTQPNPVPRPDPSGSAPNSGQSTQLNPTPTEIPYSNPTQPYPGSTPPQPSSGQPNPTPGQVTIRRGDTLWEIARDQLGSGTRWRELLKADGSSFTEQEARRLKPGESVQLPEAKRGKHPAPTGTPAPSPIQDRTSDVVVGRKPNGKWDIKVMPEGVEKLKRDDTNEMRLQLQYDTDNERTLGIAIKNSERVGITAEQVDQATDALLENAQLDKNDPKKWARWFPPKHNKALKKALNAVDKWAKSKPPFGIAGDLKLKYEWSEQDLKGEQMKKTVNNPSKPPNHYRVELENLKGHNLKLAN
ncbi:MAG: S8 family serine peptidase [Myxacorys californica WJT36-NPBG1]|jgi:hypothetical protein|nr:S8 family serine peptidase [Myxacorys californica WJT36-NPBG1]